jgi:hypothetical protein
LGDVVAVSKWYGGPEVGDWLIYRRLDFAIS